ncbi:hypothetical protein fugu_001298 [Takifugu bimaculatus]|uniref:Uncharacterized protein n=1 Tax=Takifugu bimaculatus TaxID=433685 RepID=A0A4Z2CJ50_9TELE|nr:hypothetical protein fugu_001298 [Takifugu bimaculatus]
MVGSGLNSWGNILLSASTAGMLSSSKISSSMNQEQWIFGVVPESQAVLQVPGALQGILGPEGKPVPGFMRAALSQKAL